VLILLWFSQVNLLSCESNSDSVRNSEIWFTRKHQQNVKSVVGFISITRYRNIDHGLVNLAISRCPEIARYSARTHISTCARCLPVQTEHKNNVDQRWLPRTVIWSSLYTASRRQVPPLPHLLSHRRQRVDDGSGGESSLGGQASTPCYSHARGPRCDQSTVVCGS